MLLLIMPSHIKMCIILKFSHFHPKKSLSSWILQLLYRWVISKSTSNWLLKIKPIDLHINNMSSYLILSYHSMNLRCAHDGGEMCNRSIIHGVRYRSWSSICQLAQVRVVSLSQPSYQISWILLLKLVLRVQFQDK